MTPRRQAGTRHAALGYRIRPELVVRPWGRRGVSDWFPWYRGGEPIGEAWLTGGRSQTRAVGGGRPAAGNAGVARHGGHEPAGNGNFPVLAKLLFSDAPLSVQVHPNDAYAERHGFGRGKNEAWFVIAVRAGARIGVGLKPGVEPDAFAAACRAGRGAEALEWMEPRPGDCIFVPAGTVHAIGAGITICELQQQSDATFRLDDYGRRDAQGRARPLHLEHGLAVMRRTRVERVRGEPGRSRVLIETPWFRVRQWVPGGAGATMERSAGVELLVNVNQPRRAPIRVVLAGERRHATLRLRSGEALLVTERTAGVRAAGAGTLLAVAAGAQP